MNGFAAWKANAALVGPGVLLWVRNPRESTGRRTTGSHWFVVVDVAPAGKIDSGSILHIVGISSHPRDMNASVLMDTSGTPLKGTCYACFDWELENYLSIIESSEDDWDYEIRGAQLDRWDASCEAPSYVNPQWFAKSLLPARRKYHEATRTAKPRGSKT